MRPKSIRLFEVFFLGSAALGVLSTLMHYDAMRAYSLANGGAAAAPLIGILIALPINLLFWFLIARRASNWAKWVVVVLTVVGVLGMPSTLSQATALGFGPLDIAGSVIVTIINVISIAFLFRADARRWLSSRGKDNGIDTQVFE